MDVTEVSRAGSIAPEVPGVGVGVGVGDCFGDRHREREVMCGELCYSGLTEEQK